MRLRTLLFTLILPLPHCGAFVARRPSSEVAFPCRTIPRTSNAPGNSARSRCRVFAQNDGETFAFPKEKQVSRQQPTNLQWVCFGVSAAFLAQFSSMYTQLPGLFGSTGLLPIVDRITNVDNLWLLDYFKNPELGMEIFTVLGIAVSAAQIVFGKLRQGIPGAIAYAIQWLCWHDLVMAGGRFMAYQMDLLFLDAAPLIVLSMFMPVSATFGLRWLLSRLYIGAGAVKLLSCDPSWRDLSAVHWHFQSQPLPNPIGALAYLHMPSSVSDLLTWITLVGEMSAPFLFLAPSTLIRRGTFALHLLLMVGIATFGDFGTLQALLIILGVALLDDYDLPPAPGMAKNEPVSQGKTVATTETASMDLPNFFLSAISIALAAAGGFWAVNDIGARCLDTLAVEPLVLALAGLGAVVAFYPLLDANNNTSRQSPFGTVLANVAIVLGSASTMARGLGVTFLPSLDIFNLGAIPYGLFSVITGVNGRPVAVIEAAQSMEGPWKQIPLLYQVNDPSTPLPFPFPHFPRLDWTLWFIPNGETGVWIARFFQGLTMNDPAVVGLVDKEGFHSAFPTEPPAIVRVVPRIYELNDKQRWLVSADKKYAKDFVVATYQREDLDENGVNKDESSWPSVEPLWSVASAGRPEHFVWGCIGSAEAARRMVSSRDETEK